MSRIYLLVVSVLWMICAPVWAADHLLFSDGFESKTLGKSSGVSFAAGKDGLAASFDAPEQTIEYPEECFSLVAGRVEFDVQLKKPLSTKRPIWCLFSDIGAAGSHTGAVTCRWMPTSGDLDYGIYESNVGHHWIQSKGFDWQPGRWYKIGLVYGLTGMKLEVDGQVVASNDYRGGLGAGPKKLGYYDAYFSTAPMLVDNFKTYRTDAYDLRVSEPLVCPHKDGFLDRTVISYEVAESCTVTLEVLGSTGSVLKTIQPIKPTKPGQVQTHTWNGSGLPTGDYQIRMIAASPSGRIEKTLPISINQQAKWREPRNVCKDYYPRGVFYMWEDDFWISGTHVDDEVKARVYYERTLGDLAKQGFNTVFAVWTPTDHRKMVLDIAQEHGIKVVVYLHEIYQWISGDGKANIINLAAQTVKEIKDHPAVAGYYIIDEPGGEPTMLKRTLNARKALEVADPKHPSFYCFIGQTQYDLSLKTVGGQALFIDLYPVYTNWNGDLNGYIGALAYGQKNAEQYHIPLWMATQIFGKPNAWKIPTPEEIRAQVWLSLAYGTKGFIHFVYQSTTSIQSEWLQGVLYMDLKVLDHRLDELQRINGVIKRLEPLLLLLRPAEIKLPAAPDSVVVKTFTAPKGGRVAIIANKSTTQSVQWPWHVKAVDALTGDALGPVVTLLPGDGKVLRLEK